MQKGIAQSRRAYHMGCIRADRWREKRPAAGPRTRTEATCRLLSLPHQALDGEREARVRCRGKTGPTEAMKNPHHWLVSAPLELRKRAHRYVGSIMLVAAAGMVSTADTNAAIAAAAANPQ